MWWIWLFWTTINPLLNSGGASYKMIIFRPIVCRPLVFFWFSALFFSVGDWSEQICVLAQWKEGGGEKKGRVGLGGVSFWWRTRTIRCAMAPAQHTYTLQDVRRKTRKERKKEREPHNVTWTDRPFGVLASCWLFVGILSPTYSFFHPVIMRLSTVTRLGSFAFKGKKTCDSLRRNLSLSGTERKEITNVIGESNRLFFFF